MIIVESRKIVVGGLRIHYNITLIKINNKNTKIISIQMKKPYTHSFL